MIRVMVLKDGVDFFYVNTTVRHSRDEIFAEALNVVLHLRQSGAVAVLILNDGADEYRLA